MRISDWSSDVCSSDLLDEARGPMGMGKWDHIRALCDLPTIAERYQRRFGRPPSDEDVTAIYERFMPLQIAKVGEHSALIPGALACIAALRERGQTGRASCRERVCQYV